MFTWRLNLTAELLKDLPKRPEAALTQLLLSNEERWTRLPRQSQGNSGTDSMPSELDEGPAPPIPHVSRSQVEKWIQDGRVSIDGITQTTAKNLVLIVGVDISIAIPPPRPLEVHAEEIELNILYEDNSLLVLNKPPSLTVHPSETQKSNTLVNALVGRIENLSGIGGVLRPGIVHRIDKDTSGTLVITKSDLAHQRLIETFSKHDIDRVYWALCFGAPSEKNVGNSAPWKKIESLLGRSSQDRKKMSMNVTQGRKAITYYRCVEAYGSKNHRSQQAFASLMEIRLETGRTHQIRVHLAHEGFSLLGDPVYGTPTPQQSKWKALPKEIQEAVQQLPGQALHARTLGFMHPEKGFHLSVEAAPPPGWNKLWLQLQHFRLYKTD